MMIKKKCLFSSQQCPGGQVAVFRYWVGFFAYMVDWLTAAHYWRWKQPYTGLQPSAAWIMRAMCERIGPNVWHMYHGNIQSDLHKWWDQGDLDGAAWILVNNPTQIWQKICWYGTMYVGKLHCKPQLQMEYLKQGNGHYPEPQTDEMDCVNSPVWRISG